jgi:hypothetical protein
MQPPRIQHYDGYLRYDLRGNPTFNLNLRNAEKQVERETTDEA